MADKRKGVDLSAEDLKKIEDVADKAERVSRRRSADEDVGKEREDAAYGAALKPIMKQGYKGKEAGDLARTVGKSVRQSRRGDVLHDHPRSKKKED